MNVCTNHYTNNVRITAENDEPYNNRTLLHFSFLSLQPAKEERHPGKKKKKKKQLLFFPLSVSSGPSNTQPEGSRVISSPKPTTPQKNVQS